MTAHHDYGQALVDLLDAVQRFQTIDARHPDIEQHTIHALLAQLRDAFLAGGSGENQIPLILEQALQRIADRLLVIDYHDTRCHGCSMLFSPLGRRKQKCVGEWREISTKLPP